MVIIIIEMIIMIKVCRSALLGQQLVWTLRIHIIIIVIIAIIIIEIIIMIKICRSALLQATSVLDIWSAGNQDMALSIQLSQTLHRYLNACEYGTLSPVIQYLNTT